MPKPVKKEIPRKPQVDTIEIQEVPDWAVDFDEVTYELTDTLGNGALFSRSELLLARDVLIEFCDALEAEEAAATK